MDILQKKPHFCAVFVCLMLDILGGGVFLIKIDAFQNF
ncbi:MAG: hypothetical protein RL757_898 [Bacteroidota bacterium]|jgi:hypothetical protein